MTPPCMMPSRDGLLPSGSVLSLSGGWAAPSPPARDLAPVPGSGSGSRRTGGPGAGAWGRNASECTERSRRRPLVAGVGLMIGSHRHHRHHHQQHLHRHHRRRPLRGGSITAIIIRGPPVFRPPSRGSSTWSRLRWTTRPVNTCLPPPQIRVPEPQSFRMWRICLLWTLGSRS